MPLVQLESQDAGVVILVRARPAARRNAIEGVHDGALRVSVTAAPEKGKANKAVAELLAKAIGVSRSQLQIVAGHKSTQKRFLVADRSLEDVRHAIEQHFRDK